jgi:hypothetical protein
VGLVTTTDAMARGRADDTARRRQKVTKAINQTARDGGDLTASAIARQAGVDRSFLYRHRDLLEQLHRAPGSRTGRGRSRSADQPRIAPGRPGQRPRTQPSSPGTRPAPGAAPIGRPGRTGLARVRLGATVDIETLQRQIVMLEQAIVELTKAVEDRDRDLASRAANRELMIRVNSPATRPG